MRQARRPPTRDVVSRFPGASELVRDTEALSYHALLVACFVLLCADVLPPAAFMVLGLCFYVRNFQALHEACHTRRVRRNPLRRIRNAAMIVNSPLQFGRDQLVRDHLLHHEHVGDPTRDPDVALNRLPWWSAVLHATFQPELGLLSFVRRAGYIGPSLRNALVYNFVVFAALVALAGADIVWWIAVTRLGSLACWFIFDWVLHNPQVWEHADPIPVPRVLHPLWILMFSRENLTGVQYHTVHHAYPSVTSGDLKALHELLLAATRAPAPEDSSTRMAA